MQNSMLPALSAPRDILRSFTPNWFAVTMGTGILALLLPKLPLIGPRVHALGEGLWLANAALFAVFTVLFLARALLHGAETRATLTHPLQSMFLGAIPMGLATVVNGLIVYGGPKWGGAALSLAHTLWLADATLSVLCGVLVPYLMFTRQDHALERMSAVWLLPIVPCEVAAASAGLLLPHLDPARGQGVLYAAYILWALSVPLALALLGVLLLRLAQHKLPPRELGVSMWLPLGPLGTGALGLVLLGKAASPVLSASGVEALSPVFAGVGVLGGVLLWGYGAWWLLLALLTTGRFLRDGLPFNLGWWGFTFPLGVFASATFALADATRWSGFSLLGGSLTLLLAALWGVVVTRTVRGAWSGTLG